MKQYTIGILFALIFTKSFACSCENWPKPVAEFYSAAYVFEGKVVSKVYASDSLSYAITFDISKHYKNGDNPKTLDFNKESEWQYTGVRTSCDWSVNKNENWLVYAYYYNEELTFDFHCSNSKLIDLHRISNKEQKVLDHGNSFKPENYIYHSELDFKESKPISKVDSILKNVKIKEYEKSYAGLKLLIDDKGNLEEVTTVFGYGLKADPIYNLTEEFYVSYKRPPTEFEKEAIALVRKITKWEVKYYDKTAIPVFYTRNFYIKFDQKSKEWKYKI